MRAAVYHGREDVRLEEVPDPAVGPGELKLRVHHAGICGSDLHEYYDGPLFTRTEPHPFSGVCNPVILGHELCGEVIDVGPGVTGWEEGDLVAVIPGESCGTCTWCRMGERVLCEAKAIHGYTRAGGGLAEQTVITESMAVRLPRSIDAFRGALVEPMTVGCVAALRTRAVPGDLVAVHGAGPIGLGVLFALRAMGVRAVAIDPSPQRRAAVASLGFDDALDPAEVDVVAAVREISGGRGATASVDAAGVTATLDACMDSTRRDGLVVLVAWPTAPLRIEIGRLRRFAVHLTTTGSPVRETFEQVIEWMDAGLYPTQGWTEGIAFDDLISEGFEPLHQQRKMKVVVDMTSAGH